MTSKIEVLLKESKTWRGRYFRATIVWMTIVLTAAVTLVGSLLSPEEWNSAMEFMRMVTILWAIVVVLCSVKSSLVDLRISELELKNLMKRKIELEIWCETIKPEEQGGSK